MIANGELYRYRKPEHDIDRLFIGRWSPRAMSGEEIPTEQLMSLFEAARWAPSSYNNQPWRFFYARRGTEHWDMFFNLLVEQNRLWAKHAAALIVIVSKETFDYNNKPSRTHSFDTGAAWENLALQGSAMGLVVHGMQGFSYEQARTVLQLPEGYTVEAMAAVGRPGNREDLPPEQQEREFPSGRKSLPEIVREGKYPTGPS